mmetsp:Transcript_111207/g.346621  ORF Transcript_111207/g.346621 Transcript_111207/m.346621 type:complete len:169 (+) Transcript_111207:455-961(+)
MSGHMRDMAVGEALEFRHIDKNVKIQYPFGRKHITAIAGGTGILPILQALHAILGTPGDATQVALLFGNRTSGDIIGRGLLEAWAAGSGGRLKVVNVVSRDDPSWTGRKGHIDRALIEEHSSPLGTDALIMVCGPPPLYDALCGPRDQAELTGTLAEMGYKAEQVFKF